MTPEFIRELIHKKEGLHTEFKEARSALPKTLFESICAMLNTDGGNILLGVKDNGEILGVEVASIAQWKKDLANLSNNPQQLDLPYVLFPYEMQIDGKWIVVIPVPVSSQLHKHKGDVYLRSEDGDYKVRSTAQLAGIINRKLGIFTEQRLIPHLDHTHLRQDLLKRAVHLMGINHVNHPWLNLEIPEWLRLAGFIVDNPDNGKPCITLAGVLLFGTDAQIAQHAPGYRFDCLLRRHDTDRYDDRVMIHTNLLDAYEQMMSFVEKHLNDPFYLEGIQRISLRDKIFREAVSNIIAHREYLSGSPGRLMIYQDKVVLDNPCTAHYFGPIEPTTLQPFAHNPNLCKFMIQLGRFDSLGSGVRNISKYLPLYANGAKPVFRETNHGFELTIPLVAESGQVTGQVRPESRPTDPVDRPSQPTQSTDPVEKLALLLQLHGELAPSELQDLLGLKHRPTFRVNYLHPAMEQGVIVRTIPDKPNSRLQKYKLSEKGRKLVEGMG